MVYQSLLLDPEAESGGDGPAENNALNQSLMLARFDLDGKGKKNHGAKPVSRNRLNDYIAKDQPGIPPRVKRRSGDLRRGKASPSPSIARYRPAPLPHSGGCATPPK